MSQRFSLPNYPSIMMQVFRTNYVIGFLLAFAFVSISGEASAQQMDCNDPQAFNCDLAASGASECVFGNFLVSAGADFLPTSPLLDDLSYDAGSLGTGIPDTLLTVFDAGDVEGFFGIIRRNAPGQYPDWNAESGYSVPAGYSPISTSNPGLSELSTWNVIGFVNLGTLTFAELNVELLFDLDPASFTPIADYSSLSISAGLGADAGLVSSFASNENLGSSAIELIAGGQPFLPFNPEAEGEYGVGVRITNACGTMLFERIETIQVVNGIAGCPFEGACNYVDGATLPQACDFLSCLSTGCTDPTACNFDADALYEDGSCDYSCYPQGCTNPAACNFDPLAFVEDGSCDFMTCAGCVDAGAANFDPLATIDDGSCEFPGCMFPSACNYDPIANVSDGSCEYVSCSGCNILDACNYDPSVLIVDNSTCTYAAAGYDCDGNCLSDTDGDGVCDANEILGCTDVLADNFNASATDDDGSCVYVISGCLNPLACNFNFEAEEDDGSCEFLSCVGCTDVEACNFDPEAIYADMPSCIYPEAGYDCDGNCLSDLDFDGICAEFEVLGCTDALALNFDPAATDLDGSCEYLPTCNDTSACSTDDYEAFCIQVEVVATHDGPVGTADLTGMTTYRIYALCEDSTDVVSSVAGDDEFPTYIHSTGEVFQSEFGAVFAQDVNPGLFGVLPELQYDSWLTIGLDGPAGEGESGVTAVEGLDPWPSTFEETGTLAIQDEVGGLWFVLDNPTNAVAGSDLRVLLAQITTNGTLTGSLLVQFFQEGDGPNAAIKKFININEACMLPSTEGCEYAQEGYDCDGNCLNDSDNDGVCDAFEIAGCLDELACNFDPDATDDGGGCIYAEGAYDCDGNCVNDTDNDGVCDSLEVFGCNQEAACNYNSNATEDDGSCVFAQSGLDCDGNCLNDVDQDGVCDENELFGCIDVAACNYDSAATEDDGTCNYPDQYYDCAGNCLNDSDADGVCDELEIAGCTDETALNYNPEATDDDGSCEADPCNPDVTPPYFTFVPADSTITCDAPMPTGMAMAEDDCSDVIVTFIDGPIEYVFECPPYNYFCTRTFTATDAAGNSADTIQYITVVDTIAPYFIFTPEDTIYVDEALGQTIPLGEVAVEDACDLMADWLYEDEILTSVNDTTTIQRTFTASDQCGNESTWVQIIIVYEATLGCMDESACNYDPTATADDGSCTFAEDGYDCDGNCLEDSDGDGVCDLFEVNGCTASNACNFEPAATDDDGSCDFCSCAEGVFGHYGLEIEVVAEHDSGDLAGKTTYRFYVTTESPDDFVSSIYGSDQDTLVLHTTTAWHQDPLGANYAQGVNPTLYDMFPDLAFDSWLTIGLEGPADLGAGEQEVTTLGPPVGSWIEDFAAGNSVQVDDEVGGAWFVLNGASNGIAGDDLRVLVAQLTTDGEISGRINAQIFGEGIGANDLRFSFDFEGAQWLNNGGLTNACGCTDASAYNYDDAADYDDGACAYCGLSIEDVMVSDISCFGETDGSVSVASTGASTDTIEFALVPDGVWGLDSTWMNLSAGLFDVIAIDGNGCSDTVSVEVIEPEELLVTIDDIIDQTEGLADGSIAITVTGGTLDYSFDWSGLSGAYTSNEEDIDGLLAGNYNVVVTDANGCTASVDEITIEVIVGVDELGAVTLQVWPNPAADFLTVEWPHAVSAEGGELEVFNAMGQRMVAQAILGGVERSTLNLGDWASGRYTIRLTSGASVVTVPVLILH